jgi:large subunit ribosomal protein L31
MKKNRHPQVNDINAQCACGSSFQTTSTKPEMKVTICSGCHPFFTGSQRHVDTAGRIEKFNKRFKKGAK